MKVHVLFDNKGNVGVMSHPNHGLKGASRGHGGFLSGSGQLTAYLDVPPDLAHLKPRDLHEAVRVEHKGNPPYLVAKAK